MISRDSMEKYLTSVFIDTKNIRIISMNGTIIPEDNVLEIIFDSGPDDNVGYRFFKVKIRDYNAWMRNEKINIVFDEEK